MLVHVWHVCMTLWKNATPATYQSGRAHLTSQCKVEMRPTKSQTLHMITSIKPPVVNRSSMLPNVHNSLPTNPVGSKGHHALGLMGYNDAKGRPLSQGYHTSIVHHVHTVAETTRDSNNILINFTLRPSWYASYNVLVDPPWDPEVCSPAHSRLSTSRSANDP